MSGSGGYRLITPVGWSRIPLADARRDSAIERIVQRQFRGIDNAPHLKSQLRRMLAEEASRAAESNGIELYISNLLMGPVPLESTLITSVLPVGDNGGPDLEELAAGLATDGADRALESCEVVELPAGRAVRRASLLNAASESVAGETVEVPATFVMEFFVPTPVPDRLLLLTFSTLLVPIREAFEKLFDAVAGTVGWRDPVPGVNRA